MSVETSREAFLAALERLLSRPDCPPPGINTVAREAGLNKVLIYRYFGTWDGLLEAFAQRVNPWRDLRHEVEAGLALGRWADPKGLARWLFGDYLRRLVDSPLLQNLLRLSLLHRDPLQAALEKDREEEGLALARAVGARFPLPTDVDLGALTALLTGGLTWLVLAGTRAQVFNGLTFIGPNADALHRLQGAIDAWTATLTVPSPSDSL